jgi:hypothetical protein
MTPSRVPDGIDVDRRAREQARTNSPGGRLQPTSRPELGGHVCRVTIRLDAVDKDRIRRDVSCPQRQVEPIGLNEIDGDVRTGARPS